MEHFYHNIQGWFDFDDIYRNIIEESPLNAKFAEIGVWKGKSLSYFVVEAINSNKQFEIYAIDTFRGSDEHQAGNFAYEPLLDTEDGLYNHFLENIDIVKERVNVVRKDSVDASMDFPDNYFDAIFIDAGHSFNDVLSDLIAWYPKLKSGSFMYGHDVNWPTVSSAVEMFCFFRPKFFPNERVNFDLTSVNCWRISKNIST